MALTTRASCPRSVTRATFHSGAPVPTTLRSSRTRQTQRSSPTLRNFHTGKLLAPRSVSLGLLGGQTNFRFRLVKDARSHGFAATISSVRMDRKDWAAARSLLSKYVIVLVAGDLQRVVTPHSVEGLLFRDLPTDGRASNGSPLSKAGRQQRHRQRRSRQPYFVRISNAASYFHSRLLLE